MSISWSATGRAGSKYQLVADTLKFLCFRGLDFVAAGWFVITLRDLDFAITRGLIICGQHYLVTVRPRLLCHAVVVKLSLKCN